MVVKADSVVLEASKAATVRLGQADDLEAVAGVEPRIHREEFQLRGHVVEFE
jgi:hypothetical protein